MGLLTRTNSSQKLQFNPVFFKQSLQEVEKRDYTIIICNHFIIEALLLKTTSDKKAKYEAIFYELVEQRSKHTFFQSGQLQQCTVSNDIVRLRVHL